MGISNRQANLGADIPVVMRLRHHRGGIPQMPKRLSARHARRWNVRTDRLIAISASPIVVLLVYLCWQWTATPELPFAPVDPTYSTKPAPAHGAVVPNELPMLPAEEESASDYSSSEAEVLPIMPEFDPNFRPSSATIDESDPRVRRAECWKDRCPPPDPNGSTYDPEVVRIQSVEPAPCPHGACPNGVCPTHPPEYGQEYQPEYPQEDFPQEYSQENDPQQYQQPYRQEYRPRRSIPVAPQQPQNQNDFE